MSIIIPANSAVGGGDQGNSLRFDQGSSAYLKRSLGTTTSQQKGTFSYWVKRAKIGASQVIYSNEVANDNNRGYIQFESNDAWRSVIVASGSTEIVVKTNRLFRDVSAWYHIVVRIDTTQSTTTDRLRLYVNGVQETSFEGYQICDQNATLKIFEGGQTNKNLIAGIYASGSASSYLGGYFSEFVYCDGQTLGPTSFGEFDSDSGIWKPIDVSGLTFGNMGFYLDFEDSSALGNDAAGSNNWSVVNLTAIDQTTDNCTNNFATLNVLSGSLANNVLSEGNLTIAPSASGGSRWRPSTIAPSTGKWYAEFKATSNGTINTSFGVTPQVSWDSIDGEKIGSGAGGENKSVGYFRAGSVRKGDSEQYSASSYTTNDIIGVAMDLDNFYVYFSKNGVYQNSGNPESGATGTGAVSLATNLSDWSVSISQTGTTATANYGSPTFTGTDKSDGNDRGSFEYAPPAGYLALCSANLSEVLS